MTEEEVIRTNFSLLRWMNGTHEALVEKVGGSSAWKKLSDYVLGNDTPSQYERQSIESKLSLPKGWTSRNNESLLALSVEDFELVQAIVKLDPKTKRALRAFATAAGEA